MNAWKPLNYECVRGSNYFMNSFTIMLMRIFSMNLSSNLPHWTRMSYTTVRNQDIFNSTWKSCVRSCFVYSFEMNIFGNELSGSSKSFTQKIFQFRSCNFIIKIIDVFCIAQFNLAIVNSYFHILNVANLLLTISSIDTE